MNAVLRVKRVECEQQAATHVGNMGLRQRVLWRENVG